MFRKPAPVGTSTNIFAKNAFSRWRFLSAAFCLYTFHLHSYYTYQYQNHFITSKKKVKAKIQISQKLNKKIGINLGRCPNPLAFCKKQDQKLLL
ncbi:MAG: hypothetical protein EOM28_07235 [Clostridia bacterium]|nr:hypothetical protein [Clostridia bacterium]